MRTPPDLSEEKLLSVRIVESNEPLADIRKQCPMILVHRLLEKNGSKPLVRRNIAKMLNQAKSFLPKEVTIMVRDALRPINVQRRSRDLLKKRFQREHPTWLSIKIEKEVNKFIADPDSLIPPAHTTGAAVDVVLGFLKSKRSKIMKIKNLSYQEQAKVESKKTPGHVIKNRKLLYEVMTKAGFVSNPNEWWHYSYGEVFAVARIGGKIAKYGKISLSNSKDSGQVLRL